mmetsp:Transcript_36969/g.105143  ORF Transcript_36969/g.105143 Transcript_36969/m.105143 type:complete len:201 (+) Transcript_36969:548-1150(+)
MALAELVLLHRAVDGQAVRREPLGEARALLCAVVEQRRGVVAGADREARVQEGGHGGRRPRERERDQRGEAMGSRYRRRRGAWCLAGGAHCEGPARLAGRPAEVGHLGRGRRHADRMRGLHMQRPLVDFPGEREPLQQPPASNRCGRVLPPRPLLLPALRLPHRLPHRGRRHLLQRRGAPELLVRGPAQGMEVIRRPARS